jgi:hypothetical protein
MSHEISYVYQNSFSSVPIFCSQKFILQFLRIYENKTSVQAFQEQLLYLHNHETNSYS